VNLPTGLLCAVWLAGIAGILSLALAPLFARLARRLRVVDIPRGRSIHTTPIPLLGGLAILSSLILTTILHLAAAAWLSTRPDFLTAVFSDLQYNIPGLSTTWGRLGVIFAGGVALAALGLADDLWDLGVRSRLLAQVAVAIAVVALGIRPSLHFLPVPVGFAIAVVWLVGITNSFNLIDGADGLATGLAAISSALLGITMCLTNHPCTAALLFALCGACLGFLRYNWHPAQLFLGSSGSLFLGYILGATTLIATFMSGESVWLFPLLIPVLVLAVPLYDTTSVILIRLGLKQRIWEGDQRHFHHRLMRIGFSVRQCVAFMYLLALTFGAGGLLLAKTSLIPNLVVMGQAGVLIGMIVLMERVVGRVVGRGISGPQPLPREPAVSNPERLGGERESKAASPDVPCGEPVRP